MGLEVKTSSSRLQALLTEQPDTPLHVGFLNHYSYTVLVGRILFRASLSTFDISIIQLHNPSLSCGTIYKRLELFAIGLKELICDLYSLSTSWGNIICTETKTERSVNRARPLAPHSSMIPIWGAVAHGSRILTSARLICMSSQKAGWKAHLVC